MNIFVTYIRDFFKTINTGLFIFCLIYSAIIIFVNYRIGLEPKIISGISNRIFRFAAVYFVYLAAFAIPYVAVILFGGKQIVEWKALLVLVFLAPAIFAAKVSSGGVAMLLQLNTAGAWGKYAAIVLRWPSKLLTVVMPLYIIWWVGKYQPPFFGFTFDNIDWKPYLAMLFFMIPLIAWASTQNDFLQTYPRLREVSFIESHSNNPWVYKSLFLISYGIDFITIELFFRGFLVLAFVRYAGPDAILPMAVFYCSIHFGKPLAECISSFFGGLILGIVVYKTKSIMGGLAVHLGIAWLMELGGVVALVFRNR